MRRARATRVWRRSNNPSRWRAHGRKANNVDGNHAAGWRAAPALSRERGGIVLCHQWSRGISCERQLARSRRGQIGRASCRERVEKTGGGGVIKKKRVK